MSNHFRISIIFFIAFVTTLIISFIVGIDDNLPGVILLYLSSIFLVLTLIFQWKNNDRYLYLILGSILGLILFGLLHNLFEVLEQNIKSESISIIVNYIGIGFFFIALFLAPSALIVGIFGIFINKISKKWYAQFIKHKVITKFI